MPPPRFEFASVSKQYDDRTALRSVSFEVRSGEHSAILGPSGCGKSTVLRLLAGLEAPSAGQVFMDGNMISGPERILTPAHERGVGMVFQDLALWPNLTVTGNVLLGLSGATLTRSEARKRASEALMICGIERLGDRRPETLSGGEQQRAALARAVAVRPSFLLLDEPFSGLDLVSKARLLKEIAILAAQRELTVVLVSHDPAEATALCTTAIVLDDGHVRESGTWAELLRDPRSELLKTFKDHLLGLTPSHFNETIAVDPEQR